MPNINFEFSGTRGSPSPAGPPVQVTGVSTAALPNYTGERMILVSPGAVQSAMKVAAGWYEHTSMDASGNWTYSPCNRGG
jgi:hypothetical protein